MILQTPDPEAFGAALVTGWTQLGIDESFKGAVILKAAYDLTDPGGGDPFGMALAGDPARAAVVYADEGDPLLNGGGNPVDFDLRYEADIALEKERTDIVVAGYVSGTTDGAVVIGGQQWMRRDTSVVKVNDAARNLFGWQSKPSDLRRISVPSDFEPEPGDQLPPNYGPLFNNFYRRGDGFSTPANRNTQPLPAGAVVEVHKSADASDAAPFRFVLPALAYHARYRAYCGHGPDEAPHWRIGQIGALRPDTLLVWPDALQATILWRTTWAWDAAPGETYRKIQIFEGSG